jgi:hypothetical protein
MCFLCFCIIPIQKQNKHIVTYHGRLRFCYKNDTETKQTQTLHTMCLFCFCVIPITETKQLLYAPFVSVLFLYHSYNRNIEISVIGITQKKTKHIAIYHILLRVCYGNDTETKQIILRRLLNIFFTIQFGRLSTRDCILVKHGSNQIPAVVSNCS